MFLGLEVTYIDIGLFLNQSKYAHEISERAHLLDSIPVTTPLIYNTAFTTNSELYNDPTHYRFLVCALKYLTVIRPDISYVVN